mmetsp:Transcript_5868/g.15019  ORF Transcript_5868/g.15019 Transcript_5868/m.15019 type:complete len:97 (+) Transcript_5868:322-612(+)
MSTIIPETAPPIEPTVTAVDAETGTVTVKFANSANGKETTRTYDSMAQATKTAMFVFLTLNPTHRPEDTPAIKAWVDARGFDSSCVQNSISEIASE